VEEKLMEFEQEMREAENESHEGKRKQEANWPILQIHHKRTRYIFELYKEKKISPELYRFLTQEKYADASLIAKWKKQGYEKLCCLSCIQPREHAYGTVCICRVPKSQLDSGKIVQCNACGCRGCSSSDTK
jgi:bud site selection protein 31